MAIELTNRGSEYSRSILDPKPRFIDPRDLKRMVRMATDAEEKSPYGYGKEALFEIAKTVLVVAAAIFCIAATHGAAVGVGIAMLVGASLNMIAVGAKAYKMKGVEEIKLRAKEAIFSDELRKMDKRARQRVEAGVATPLGTGSFYS